MGAASDYLENKLLDHVFKVATYNRPEHIYVALCKSTIDDTHTGSTLPGEVSGGGYERTLCDDWSSASGGVSNNENKVLFQKASAPWGIVSNVALCDAQTGGNVLTYGRLYDYKNVATDDQMEFEAGGLTVAMDETLTGALVLVHGHAESSSIVTGRALKTTDYDWLTVDNADRIYTWVDYCGIPGGIPNRATVYTSLGVAGQAPTYAQSVTAAQVSTAIAACPSGQVVYLYPGTYNITGTYFGQTKSGVTLRGAGAGQTILHASTITNAYATYLEAQGISVASGYTRGSMAIVLSSSPSGNFIAGNLIIITEDANPNKWGTDIGTYYRTGLTSSVYLLDATRPLRFTSRITSVVGNTINLATPIPTDFSVGLNVKAYAQNGIGCTSLCGVENLTMDGNNSVDKVSDFMGLDRCWLKNVEVKNYVGSTGTIFFQASSQCEVNRCYVHDTAGYPTQSDGFGVTLYYGTSTTLVIDTIFDNTGCAILMNGAHCNALIHNYIRGVGGGNGTWQVSGINCNHGPHGVMNLFEGNSFNRFQNDSYHGSSSHNTIFRNNIHGVDPDGKTLERQLVDLCKGSYYHSVVGNVLGAASWNPYAYEAYLMADHNLGYIYVFGWGEPDSADGTAYGVPWTGWDGTLPDANVAATLLRHGNYDYFNDATVWDGSITSHDIPNSLFYSSKPSFFGSLAWPAIGPDLGTMVNDIPAKHRWDNYAVSGILADLFADEA